MAGVHQTHFICWRHNTPGGWRFGCNRRAGEVVGASHQLQGRRTLAGGPVQTSSRPANPCRPSLPSGLGVSGPAAKLQPSPGPGGRGRKGRSGAPPAQAGCLRSSARGLPAGWGLLRPSARSCLGEGLRRPPEPGSAPRAAERKGCRGRRRGGGECVGEGALTHPGRPPPPPPPRPPPRRSIPAAGACSRGARVTTAGWASPSPPAQRLSSGPLLRPGLGRCRCRRSATWPPLRRLATPFPAREGERGRRGGQRGAGGRGGGVRVWMCVPEGAGREASGGEDARARARPRPLPSLAPPPNRDPDTSLRPPPRHPGRWERRRACAALGPARAHLFCLLPHCERSAAQITAGSPRRPRLLPLRPLPGAQVKTRAAHARRSP